MAVTVTEEAASLARAQAQAQVGLLALALALEVVPAPSSCWQQPLSAASHVRAVLPWRRFTLHNKSSSVPAEHVLNQCAAARERWTSVRVCARTSARRRSGPLFTACPWSAGPLSLLAPSPFSQARISPNQRPSAVTVSVSNPLHSVFFLDPQDG